MARKWECTFIAHTHAVDGTARTLRFLFEGADDPIGAAARQVRARVRKPGLWYGVGFRIVTPLGQHIGGVIEDGGPSGLTLETPI